MKKSLLKQMLTYFFKVYNLGGKIEEVIDTRLEPKVATYSISYIVLIGFILQVPSFNRLERWIKKGKSQKMLLRKTKMHSINTVRNCFDRVNLDSLNNMDKDIIKATIKNKVFRNRAIGEYKVSVVDDVEIFEITAKCCDDW